MTHLLQLDQRDDGNAIQDELNNLTGGRSVPRVFINQVATFLCHVTIPDMGLHCRLP